MCVVLVNFACTDLSSGIFFQLSSKSTSPYLVEYVVVFFFSFLLILPNFLPWHLTLLRFFRVYMAPYSRPAVLRSMHHFFLPFFFDICRLVSSTLYLCPLLFIFSGMLDVSLVVSVYTN